MHGEVRYVRFDYPDPKQFPFPEALAHWAGAKSLVFNWNTKGAGYVVEDGTARIYALNRTGALPIDYLAGDNNQLKKAEDDAYVRFSAYGDRNLVRVVQYAALYQIFRGFEVSPAELTTRHPPIPNASKAEARRVVSWIMALDEPSIRGAAMKLRNAGVAEEEVQEACSGLAEISGKLLTVEEQNGAAGMERVVELLAASGSVLARETNEEQHKLDEQLLQVVKPIEGLNWILQKLVPIDVRKARDRYLAEAERPDYGWVKTPSIALSWSTAQTPGRIIVGGHNLSARTTLFKVSANLRAGRVRRQEDPATGRLIIEYSPADEAKIGNLVRPAARNEDKGPKEQQSLLEQQLQRASTGRADFAQSLNPPPRGPADTSASFEPPPSSPIVAGTGWQVSKRRPTKRQSDVLRSLAGGLPVAVVTVTQLPNSGYSIIHSSSKTTIEAQTYTSAIDAARSCIEDNSGASRDVILYLEGFPERQGRAFTKSLTFHFEANQDESVPFAVAEQPLDPELPGRIFGRSYDYDRAQIVKIETIQEKDGIRANVDLVVPAKVAGGPSLGMRIRMFLEGLHVVPAELLSSVRQAIGRWQQSMRDANGRVHILLDRRKLWRELQRDIPNIKELDLIYSQEGKDIYADDWNPRTAIDAEYNAA